MFSQACVILFTGREGTSRMHPSTGCTPPSPAECIPPDTPHPLSVDASSRKLIVNRRTLRHPTEMHSCLLFEMILVARGGILYL